MSSVSGSDSNRKSEDAVARRNREENKSNEAELAKRQKAELRRIQENHYREISELQRSHEKQMADMQKASNDAISARDHRYQQDMEELRSLYRKQIADQVGESREKESAYRNATQTDMKAQKENANARLNEAHATSRKNLEEKDKTYSDALDYTRKKQYETIEKVTEDLNDAHKKSYDSLLDDRNKMRADMQDKYDRYRENAEGRLKSQDIKHRQDQQTMSDNHLHTHRKERKDRSESEQRLRDGFADGLDKTKDRFQKALDKEHKTFENSYNNLQEDVNDRVHGKVRRLELENTDLKEEVVRTGQRERELAQRHMNDFKRSTQNNIEDLEMQRQEGVRASNDRMANTVDKLNKKNSDNLVTLNRAYREQMDERNRIHKQAHMQAEGDYKGRIAQNNIFTENRVKNIIEKSSVDQAKVIELAQENAKAQRRQTVDEIHVMRNSFEDDRNNAVENIRDQMRKLEVQHTERMERIVSKYEKELARLRDQQLQEKRISEEAHKRTIEELKRAQKMEIDQVVTQSRDHIRQMQEQQKQEIKTVEKRQDARVEEVLAAVKRSERKINGPS